MSEQTPKTPGQNANDVMAAMSALVGGIDIRDGGFSDAVIACVWEHEAILKLREGDPGFKESVGVGYVWYSKDEDAWHTEREKTLKALNQNSVSELCDELVKQGALFDISRPNIDQITRTDAVANCAGRLRVRGATKVIVFLQSAASVTVKDASEVTFSVPHLGAVHEIVFYHHAAENQFSLTATRNPYKGFSYRLISAEEAETLDADVLKFGDMHYELLNAPHENWLVAFDLLYLFLKHEGKLPSPIPGNVRVKRRVRDTTYFFYSPLPFERGNPEFTSFLSDFFKYGVHEASVNEEPNN